MDSLICAMLKGVCEGLNYAFGVYESLKIITKRSCPSWQEVDVVVAVITDGDKFLVERRGLDEKLDPDVVCLPGGHVNKGESYEKALKREMLEELGITIRKTRFIGTKFHVASNGERQHSYCFVITAYEGKPTAKSAKEIFWTNNINNLSLEIDKQTIKKLIEIH